MANIIELKTETRTVSGTGAVGRLRRAGSIPAVVYGSVRDKNLNIQIDGKTFTKIIAHSASDNILCNLDLGGTTQLALVQEVQHDHLKGGILHVDFHAIKDDEVIHAEVPLDFVGAAVGVKAGGQLDLLVHHINVICLPKDLPQQITVDVTPLQVGQSLHVREITLPQGVSTRLDGGVVLALVEESKVVEETPATAAAAASATAAATKAKAKK